MKTSFSCSNSKTEDGDDRGFVPTEDGLEKDCEMEGEEGEESVVVVVVVVVVPVPSLV
jgi:hypothetical protein